MPKRATSTSIKPGEKKALGNDKTLNVTTWLKVELENVEDYGEKMKVAKRIAHDFVQTLMTTPDPALKLQYFKELMDRTEGKPKQSTDVTSGGNPITVAPLVVRDED